MNKGRLLLPTDVGEMFELSAIAWDSKSFLERIFGNVARGIRLGHRSGAKKPGPKN
jgi:hypothetical protein